MKRNLILCILCVSITRADVVTIDFNGPPRQPDGTGKLYAQYDEDGFHVQPFGALDVAPPYRMGIYGANTANRPNNGTPHLSLAYGNSMEIRSIATVSYTPLSIDVAEYSTVFAYPQQITFTGVKSDGSTVTITFSTDGLIDGTGSITDYETFYFPQSFRDIVALKASNPIALDNLVLSFGPAVPRIPVIEIDTAVRIRWQSEVGVYYRIQTSTDLMDWQDSGEPLQGDSSVMEAFDSIDSSKKFWRVTVIQ